MASYDPNQQYMSAAPVPYAQYAVVSGQSQPPPQYPSSAPQYPPDQYGSIPAALPYVEDPAARMQAFKNIAAQYEISDAFAAKLRQLEGYEIVLVLDDSGSMNAPIQDHTGGGGGAFAVQQTRWKELQTITSIVVNIAAIMDKNGLDVYFLNRPGMSGVRSSHDLTHSFAQPPAGLTPLTPVIRRVLSDKRAVMVEQKLLLIVATDGAPTDANGRVDVNSLRDVLARERNADRCFVTFMACTDDLTAVEYLNDWDRQLKHLDVVDDYQSERREIMKTKGKSYPFSFGDYLVKALLGPIDPEFDRSDGVNTCCSIM